MGAFKYFLAEGLRGKSSAGISYDEWSVLMVERLGPSVTPFLPQIWEHTLLSAAYRKRHLKVRLTSLEVRHYLAR